MASKITDRTRAVVIINPNNPTGAVYPKEIIEGILDLARRHGLMVFADEIYDQILYDDAVHHSAAALAPDLVVLTFCGLSKTYRVAGFRSGWLVVTGPRQHARNYLEGLTMLASMRLCANAPAQYAIQAALGGRQSITDLTAPGGRLHEQRNVVWEKLNEIPGVSCVKPKGALYAFPVSTPRSTRSTTTRSSSWTCSCGRRSRSSRAPASTGPPPTTSASSPCRTRTTWTRRSAGSGGS